VSDLILNRNPDGLDVLHRTQGLTEKCNTDAIDGRSKVDHATAEAMVKTHQARYCGHCSSLDDLATPI